MGYLNKNTILKAYKRLSKLSSDPTVQGATQKVSIIRHFIALDSFYKSYNRDCDTRDKEDRKDFIEKVGAVCNVYDDKYSTNFYYPLKKAHDCNVGSNFYSAGQVKISLSAKEDTLPYPARGGHQPLFQIKNGELLRNVSLYKNFNGYVNNTDEKVALAIWLLRKTNIPDSGNDLSANIRYTLSTIYTADFVSILFSNEQQFIDALNLYDLKLEKDACYINELDVKDLFTTNEPKRTTIEMNSKNIPYILALRTKPFMLLAGISGTGKSRIVREFAFKSCPDYLRDKDGTTPGNYCMIEVKPNWHDSTELLGYWSNINKRYMFTKFVKFLVKAKMFPEVPFFVCLDEMNLAPVEQYFAEFLSVLETRRLIKNGEGEDEVVSGVLVDKEYFAKLGTLNSTSGTLGTLKTDRDIYFKLFDIQDKDEMEKVENDSDSLLTEGLALPENVFIVGTVNMDDTTHQFSRKVIDRAMTIEMNGGALADIFKNTSDLTYSEEPMTMEDLKSKYISASEVLEKCCAVVTNKEISDYIQGIGEEGLPQRLEKINNVLHGTPFTVSYRVMNELTIYLAVLLDKAVEDGTEVTADNFKPYVEEAIDKILLMKILPRVEGDDEMFRISDDERNLYGLNNQVDENGINHEYTKLDWLREIAPQHTAEDEQKYMAVDKLKEMIGRLNRQSFTRYWP